MNKLFDIYYDGNRPKITTLSILKEDIAEGASIPTYVVKDEYGRTSRISKDMYATSIEAAIIKELEDIRKTLLDIDNREHELHQEREALRLKRDALNRLTKVN